MKFLLSLGMVMFLTIAIVTGYKQSGSTDVLELVLQAAAQYDTAEEMASKTICMISCHYYTWSICYSVNLLMHACSSVANCIKRTGWSTDLTQAKLNTLVNTVLGLTYGAVFIFVPSKCGNLRGRLFRSGNGHHAEDRMLNTCANQVVQFYLSSAPCPTCAMKLMYTYANLHQKPTIYIARPYEGEGKSGKGGIIANTMCLAMLVRAGFNIHPWNWEQFDNYYLQNDECKKVISGETFEYLQERAGIMTEYLFVVQNMMKSCNTDFIKECKQAALMN